MKPPVDSNRAKYMTLIAAFLGWMFDGFEMGLFPLIGHPALQELTGPKAPAGDTAPVFAPTTAVFAAGLARDRGHHFE